VGVNPKYKSEYICWINIKARCFNKNVKSYKDYGGRGITICEEWRSSFHKFYADMGKRPTGCSVERIDNDGPYSKDNCKWATRYEQARNRRNNKWITYKGVTLCKSDWANKLDLDITVINWRIRKGWPLKRVLTKIDKKPFVKMDLIKDGKRIPYRTMADVARILDITLAMAHRVKLKKKSDYKGFKIKYETIL